uniref:Secreted protein n=1 Tax=Ascaris lumbricoides TaxID=6252 RepID=A0A0M3HY19_ASCLU
MAGFMRADAWWFQPNVKVTAIRLGRLFSKMIPTSKVSRQPVSLTFLERKKRDREKERSRPVGVSKSVLMLMRSCVIAANAMHPRLSRRFYCI